MVDGGMGWWWTSHPLELYTEMIRQHWEAFHRWSAPSLRCWAQIESTNLIQSLVETSLNHLPFMQGVFSAVSHAFVLHILRMCQLCQDIYIVHSTESASGWRHSSICLRSPVSHKYPYSYTSNQQQQLTTAANNTTTTCLITLEHHLLIFCWHSLHLHHK